jgi:hypothetical protein
MQTAKIVGARHHKPAVQIFQALPAETKLLLVPEPTNPYDANAIQVRLKPDAIPEWVERDLEELLLPTEFTLADLKSQDSIMLGFIPKEIAAEISLPGPTPGVLAFDGVGPLVSWDAEVSPEASDEQVDDEADSDDEPVEDEDQGNYENAATLYDKIRPI